MTTVDIQNIRTVFRSSKLKPHESNIAIASGVTNDGRAVNGIGGHNWSAEKAQDAAASNIRHTANITDFEFHINTISGGRTIKRIEILKNRGEINVKRSGGFGVPTVEITAWEGDYSTNAAGENRTQIPFVTNVWQSCLNSALNSVDSDFNRLGETT